MCRTQQPCGGADPRGCVWGHAPSPGCEGLPKFPAGFVHGGSSWTAVSRLPVPGEGGWSRVSRLAAPLAVPGKGRAPRAAPPALRSRGAAARCGQVSSGAARALSGLELGTPPAPQGAVPGAVPDPGGMGGCSGAFSGEEGAGRTAEKPLGSLANRLSLICKSLLGRNQPHENAISTQSLFWPLSCFRQKQFTLPVIKQG